MSYLFIFSLIVSLLIIQFTITIIYLCILIVNWLQDIDIVLNILTEFYNNIILLNINCDFASASVLVTGQ